MRIQLIKSNAIMVKKWPYNDYWKITEIQILNSKYRKESKNIFFLTIGVQSTLNTDSSLYRPWVLALCTFLNLFQADCYWSSSSLGRSDIYYDRLLAILSHALACAHNLQPSTTLVCVTLARLPVYMLSHRTLVIDSEKNNNNNNNNSSSHIVRYIHALLTLITLILPYPASNLEIWYEIKYQI